MPRVNKLYHVDLIVYKAAALPFTSSSSPLSGQLHITNPSFIFTPKMAPQSLMMLLFNYFAFLLVLVNAQDDEYVFSSSPQVGGNSCFGPNCVDPYDTVVLPGTTLIKTTVYEPYVWFPLCRARS